MTNKSIYVHVFVFIEISALTEYIHYKKIFNFSVKK